MTATVTAFETAWQEACGRLCRHRHDRFCCDAGRPVVITVRAGDELGREGFRLVGRSLPVIPCDWGQAQPVESEGERRFRREWETTGGR